MTTATTTTVIDHTATAGFRAWGAEFSAQLLAIGLTQTADTGQINWTTVAYTATTATAQGYEIWRFADSTLFIKFEYGTSGTSTSPGIWVTVGTGSNGSGTITGAGVTSTRSLMVVNTAAASNTTAYTSYFSRTAGHVSILWKAAGSSGTFCMGLLIIGKSVDGTGATTTTGYAVIRQASAAAPAMQCVRLIATAAVQVESVNFALIVGAPTTSVDAAGNYQAYATYMNVPDVLPFCYAAAVIIGDVPRGTSFSVAMVGASARTYLAMGNTNGVNNHSGGYAGLAMLFE